MEGRDLLVEVLGEDVDLVLVPSAGLLVPELELGNDLVGEGARHDKRRVAGGTSKVEEASLGQDDDSVSVGEDEPVALGLDVLALDSGPAVESGHVHLVVEVTDVADDGIVLHPCHVGGHDDVLVASGGDEDVAIGDDVLNGSNLVTLHARLEGADGVNLGDNHTGTGGLHGGGAALADVSVSGDESDLAMRLRSVGGV